MFADPQKNIEQFGIEPGMRIADLGTGSGFYALTAAKMAGTSGLVYAVDIQKDLLAKIKANANHEHVFNIEIIWGDIEKLGGTKLHDLSVDRVIVSNILFQLENPKDLPFEVKRILKPNGKVLVIDWRDSFGNLGPAPEAVFSEVKARDLFEKAGFKVDRTISAGEHHYGLIFRKV